MGVSWTNEQLDAINAKKRAIIVSAAAGSGKTAVLVEKLLRILSDKENPVSADRIVVVTFTNDAAEQMKHRLSAALAEASEREPENSWLTAQQALILSAKISTIHSFCFDLIRENSGLLDADPGFRVLDAAENDVISAKAAENVLDRWFEMRSEDVKLLSDFFCPGAGNEKKLLNLIPMLSKNILALPFPDKYMDSVTARYMAPPDIADDELVKIYSEYVTDQLRTADIFGEKSLEAAMEAYGASANSVDKIAKNIDLLRLETERIKDAYEKICADPSAVFSGCTDIGFDRITFYAKASYKDEGGNKIEEEYDEMLIAQAKLYRDMYKKIISGIANEFTAEDVKSDYIIHGNICTRLFALMKDIFDEEYRLKKEKNALGFSDAEQLACRLLCSVKEDGTIEKNQIAKDLADYYSIVMIDEFQDSTAVQELIFRMISKDGTADLPGTDFFAVGDVKQSIYRFRCADPRIFMKNIGAGVPYEDNNEHTPAYILLNRNFRSSRHVVDFVNAVFMNIMSHKNGGVDYGENDSLIMGAAPEDDFGPTEIIELPCCDAEESEASENGEDDAEITGIDITEARCVANKIKEMMDTLTITEKGEKRPLKPSDFCILMRNNDKASLFIQCLEELGIAASGAAEESYLESREISVLLNLLRCIDNPTLDIPLAAVMMSPMFMFTAEEMGNIRLNRSSSLYGDVSVLANEESILGRKCGNFIDVLEELREYSASRSVEELIGFIYDKTDFMAVISVYKDSSRKKANLRLLPFYAAQYDKNGTGGLSGFVRQINNMIENSKDFEGASASASEENAVQIKTIHRSKGLEFPFVFLCAARTKFNFMDVYASSVFVSDYGTAFRISDAARLASYESFPRRALSIVKEKSLRDEEMMLLYVALTRAKHKLFITRANEADNISRRELLESLSEPIGRKQIISVSKGTSMADWLDVVISLFKRDGDVYRLGDCELIHTQGGISSGTSENPDDDNLEASASRYNKTAAEKLRKMLSEEYDLTLSRTASKLTVSELAHGSSERIFSNKTFRRSDVPKGMTSAQAGTAVHAFMQYADIKALYAADDRDEAILLEAGQLAEKGLLTPVQASCVRAEAVKDFLESELCSRMMKSEEIYREKKFLVKICDLMLDDKELMVYNNTEGMLQGVADCVFREDGYYVLVDYKTDRNVDEHILRERYRRQLTLYAKALELILDSPVGKGYIYSFDLGKAVEIKL